jgi:hypothetical protein
MDSDGNNPKQLTDSLVEGRIPNPEVKDEET